MLTTAEVGHFGFLHEVKGSCAQEAALSLHVGMISPMVAAQLPLVDADPHGHPMDQFRETLETARKLIEATDQLWQSISRGVDTAQQLSDKCHHLQTAVVQRVPSTNYPEHNNEALGALGQVGQPASDLNQLASASGGDAAKPDESMADLI